MTSSSLTPDPEFAAIQAVFAALDPLDDDARFRVLSYIAARLDIEIKGPAKALAATISPATPPPRGGYGGVPEEPGGDTGLARAAGGGGPPPTFTTFAELYDAVRPDTSADKALAAGYWLQVSLNAESFDSQSANNLLKNLGHGIPNITKAIDSLKAQSPALVLQLKKAGTSQQARKTYKITVAGIREIEKLIFMWQ